MVLSRNHFTFHEREDGQFTSVQHQRCQHLFVMIQSAAWRWRFSISSRSSCSRALQPVRRSSLITWRSLLLTPSKEKPCRVFLSPSCLVFAAPQSSSHLIRNPIPPTPPLCPRLCACAWWHEMLSHQRNKAGNALRPSLWKRAARGLFSGWMCFGLFVFACFNSFHQCLCEDQVHSFTQQQQCAAMPHSLCTGRLVRTLYDCLRVRGHTANPFHFSFLTRSRLELVLGQPAHGDTPQSHQPLTRIGLSPGSHAPFLHCWTQTDSSTRR